MKKVLLGIMTCALLLASSCKKDKNKGEDNGTDPINNSTWIFKVTTFNEDGGVSATPPPYTTTVKAQEVTINGSKWLNLVDVTGVTVISIQKRADGWWYMDPQLSGTQSSLWFKTSAAVGNTYPYLYGTCTVSEVNASVTVPAGTYTDITRVKGNDSNSLEDDFWFTNTGAVLVKWETYDAKSGRPESDVYKKTSWELVDFDR
ncbi:hypothetical protein FW774_11580 [Pedobacter sp. BS3]|uniref:hypothetical protein n=1 Tax=Pedobacter sp. BS3 TaxID=2567937 RepID=UPI0011EF7358|nr:hypothetical protein [Pedobacter sp. BS3]TZF84075.1 hypothetical protein FW774_11580 [Pedobacter sp. BS3]